MNGLDYVLAAVLLVSTGIGLWRGLIRSLCSIAVLVLGVIAATLLGPAVAPLLESSIDHPAARTVVAYFAVFAAVWIVLRLIAWLLVKALKSLKLSWADRMAGAGFGLLRGVVLCALVLMGLSFALDADSPTLKGSVLRGPLDHVVALLTAVLPDDVAKDLQRRRRALGNAVGRGKEQVIDFQGAAEAARKKLEQARAAAKEAGEMLDKGKEAVDSLAGETD